MIRIVLGGSVLLTLTLAAAWPAQGLTAFLTNCDLSIDSGDPPCVDWREPPVCDATCGCPPGGNGPGSHGPGSHGPGRGPGSLGGSGPQGTGCSSCVETMPVARTSKGPAASAVPDPGWQAMVLGAGMPVWWVSEPLINLRLEDEPLGYQPARGPRIAFHLSYRQRGNVSEDPSVFGVGPHWTCSFRAYVVDFSTWQTDGSSLVRLHRAGAGWLDYHPGQPQSRDGSVLAPVPGGGFQIEYADGARDLFLQPFIVKKLGLDPWGGSPVTNAFTYYFLTARIDPFGQASQFSYVLGPQFIRLAAVVDADGRATSLAYDHPANPGLITQVVDPFNRTNRLQYNAEGYLTNTLDVAGLAASFAYDPRHPGWITNLVTPYGPTAFRHDGVDPGEWATAPSANFVVNRLLEVTEPNGGHQLFLYRENSAQLSASDPTPLIADSYPAAPDTYQFGLANSFDNSDLGRRNSLHWDALQYTGLSAAFRTAGRWQDLNLSDYKLARLRHWLLAPAPYVGNGPGVASVLSLERAASPDGLAEGQVTWFDYDGKAYPASVGTADQPLYVARVLPEGTTWFLRTTRNARGAATEISETYTAPDAATALRTNTFVYADNQVDLVLQTGPGGALVVSNCFNANHQVTQSFNAAGERTLYTYDPTSQQLQTLTRPAGLTTTFTYDSLTRRLLQMTDQPTGRTEAYTYFPNGLVQTHTDARGLTTSYSYDPLQRVIAVHYPDATSTAAVYDRLDLVAAKDRLGFWTRYLYDPVGQLLFTTNASQVVTAYGRCDCGALLWRTNAWGTAQAEGESYGYDWQGHRILTALADGTRVTNWFDALGQLVASADGVGARWFTYNQQGLLTTVSNACGLEQRTVYDLHDRPLLTTDANGVTVAYTYDGLGRLRTRTWPDGGVEGFGYTPNITGLTSHTNQLLKTTEWGYDAAGRKTCETNANGEVVRYTYSAAGDLLALTDGKRQVTTWAYDTYGRVTRKLDQTGREILRYTYDANSRLRTRWSAGKGTTLYTYDPVGLLTAIGYPTNSAVVLRYDRLGRLTNMVDTAGITAFSYWAGGQLKSEDGPWANDTVTSYYQNGLRTRLELQQSPTPWTNRFAYDAARHLTNVWSPAGAFA